MIKSITLKFTSAPPLEIPTDGVTIFVGPNNAGKSLVLQELDKEFASHQPGPTLLLKDFEIEWLSEADVEKEIELYAEPTADGPTRLVHVGNYSGDGSRIEGSVDAASMRQQYKSKDKRWLTSQYLRYFQIRLDGRTRFNLTNERGAGDLLGPPSSTLVRLFQDDPLRIELQATIYDAFGVYLVVDPTHSSVLRLRLSTVPPNGDEQSLNLNARKFHSEATLIKNAGDGVQAFAGILIAVRAGNYRSVLIDEPEAFLHPPLARKLGRELSSSVTKAGGSLMASTHSADFLIGCLQGSSKVRVVRLEHSGGKSKGRIVDPSALSEFFKKPLIRSANVISALFHDGVIVTESDNDRAFYTEILHRLGEHDKSHPSILVVNAQNKQTLKEIIGPLRVFGVAAAAIPDIDVIKLEGKDWTGLLTAANVPAALHNGLGQMRGDLVSRFKSAEVDMKKLGVDGLPVADKAAANHFFSTLEEFGIFVTRKGELERWLPEMNVTGKGTDWTVQMLDLMGSDPTSTSYLKPGSGDVWDFMRNIVKWTRNTERKGT